MKVNSLSYGYIVLHNFNPKNKEIYISFKICMKSLLQLPKLRSLLYAMAYDKFQAHNSILSFLRF